MSTLTSHTPLSPSNNTVPPTVRIQREVLEHIASGQPLDEILGRLCLLIESARVDGACSILILNARSRTLHPGVGPSLNPAALEALQGLPAAECSGSCGTAAYTGQLVVVDDTATDVRWASGPLQAFAQNFNVKACWSSPFFDKDKDVLGTFAISIGSTGSPSELDLELLRTAAHLAGIAVERHRNESELRRAHARVKMLLDERTTDLEQARSQLIEMGREVGKAEIAASVLHNVGNVLNSVNISTDAIRRHLNDTRPDNLEALATMLKDNAHRLGDYLGEDERGDQIIVYLSELAGHLGRTHGALKGELDGLNANISHIKAIVARQQTYAASTGIAIECCPKTLMSDALTLASLLDESDNIALEEHCADTLKIHVERDKLLQILVNIVINARQAIERSGRTDGRILVTLEATDDDRVLFKIADNGAGIALEHQPRIFTQGFSSRPGGHGYGLHNAHLNAKALGASLSFESQGMGKGASFELKVPRNRMRA